MTTQARDVVKCFSFDDDKAKAARSLRDYFPEVYCVDVAALMDVVSHSWGGGVRY